MYTSDEIEREIYSAAAEMRILEGLQKVNAWYAVSDDRMHATIRHKLAAQDINITIDSDWGLMQVWSEAQKRFWKYITPPFMEFDHQ